MMDLGQCAGLCFHLAAPRSAGRDCLLSHGKLGTRKGNGVPEWDLSTINAVFGVVKAKVRTFRASLRGGRRLRSAKPLDDHAALKTG